jgi:hypothetical protein
MTSYTTPSVTDSLTRALEMITALIVIVGLVVAVTAVGVWLYRQTRKAALAGIANDEGGHDKTVSADVLTERPVDWCRYAAWTLWDWLRPDTRLGCHWRLGLLTAAWVYVASQDGCFFYATPLLLPMVALTDRWVVLGVWARDWERYIDSQVGWLSFQIEEHGVRKPERPLTKTSRPR